MIWVIALLFLLSGCRTVQQESTEVKEYTNVEKIKNNVQLVSVKDRNVTITPPKQMSVSIGRDSSRIETEYAISEAVWDGVNLTHRIWNKDIFEVRATEVNKEVITDLEHKESRDHESESAIIEQKKRLLEDFFYYSGIAGWLLAIVVIKIKLF